MNRSGDDEDGEEEPEPSVDQTEVDADRIEPGHPSAENVAFVLLGVLGALYVVAQIAGLV